MKNEVGKETFITKCAHKNLLCDGWIIQHYSARHIIIKKYVQWYDIHVYWYTCIWTSVIMIERKGKKNGDFSSIQLLPFLPVSVCRTLHHFFFSVFIYIIRIWEIFSGIYLTPVILNNWVKCYTENSFQDIPGTHLYNDLYIQNSKSETTSVFGSS